ncbi:MAG: hypothetical protein JRE64_04755 [Deltaproteobacteria bacterium]|nr:hypothetical protein [Deltaproteobacteria bacterium]
MANQLIRNEVIKEVLSALKAFADIGDMDHSGLKGRIREIIAAKLLKPILPPGVEIGNGKITDSFGNLSAESDIIIYSRKTLPPLIYGHATGLFPVEACIYSIEIKSILTASEIKDSLNKARRLNALRYRETFYPLNFLKPIGPPSSFVIPALFAFSTDLSEDGLTEINRYRKYDANADSNPLIRIFCIPKRGYWWFKPDEPGEKWIHHTPTSDFDEIIDFVGGIANTIPIEIIKKGQPYYGHYIIEPRSFNKE